MKLGRKQQSNQSKPEKYWKPAADKMMEYNRSIFEVLWGKEEQRHKNIVEVEKVWTENSEVPSTPDNLGKIKHAEKQNEEQANAENRGPLEHVEPRTPDSTDEMELQTLGHHQPNIPPL